MKQYYDIVIFADYFRTSSQILYIINYFSLRKTTVGIIFNKLPLDLEKKNNENQKNFEQDCLNFGAKEIYGNAFSCNLLIIPQRPYDLGDNDNIEKINKINCKKKIVLLGLAFSGIPIYDRWIKKINAECILSSDLDFTNYLLQERNSKYSQKIIEVGLPYEENIFNFKENIDYLILNPTEFSYGDLDDKLNYVNNVYKFINEFNNNKFYIKFHNGLNYDNLISKKFMYISKFFNLKILEYFTKFNLKLLKKILIAKFYNLILKKTISLNATNKKSYYGAEIFIPFVKKGVIGGISNVAYYSLYYKKKYFNLIDFDKIILKQKKRFTKKNNSTLEPNYKYFGTKYCSDFKFDDKQFDKIKNKKNKNSLFKVIENFLN